jgi:hypothetical protein
MNEFTGIDDVSILPPHVEPIRRTISHRHHLRDDAGAPAIEHPVDHARATCALGDHATVALADLKHPFLFPVRRAAHGR